MGFGDSSVQPLQDLAFDLDGDGEPDFVLDMGATDITSHYALYRRNGACAYYVGFIDAGAIELAPESRNGLRSIVASNVCRHIGRCARHPRRYDFDGKQYVVGADLEEAPEEEEMGSPLRPSNKP